MYQIRQLTVFLHFLSSCVSSPVWWEAEINISLISDCTSCRGFSADCLASVSEG